MYDYVPEGIREKLDLYQKNKILWLDSSDYEFNTKKSYFTDLELFIHPYEIIYKKDLCEFSKVQIENIIKSINSTSSSVMLRVFSIIRKYITYAVDVQWWVTENPCSQIRPTDIVEVNKSALKESYTSLDDFYEFIDRLDTSFNDKMLLLLLRHGVLIKEVAQVKWDDVHDGFIHLERNSIKLPVDDRFMKILDEAKNEETYVIYIEEGKALRNTNVTTYVDYGYIIKQTMRGNTDIVTNSSLYSRITNLTKRNKLERISLDAMKRMRYFDFIYDIYNKNGKVSYEDVKNVVKLIDYGVKDADLYLWSKAKKIKDMFEIISGIEVQK